MALVLPKVFAFNQPIMMQSIAIPFGLARTRLFQAYVLKRRSARTLSTTRNISATPPAAVVAVTAVVDTVTEKTWALFSKL